ncbi:oxygen-independent coproporphyrinogen III oxidase [Elusimicrobiota bacterium]
MVVVDLDLIRKYDVAGPRYTSYPTALQFTSNIDPLQIISALKTENSSQRDLSLYFHIPFCDSLCWFCACTSMPTKKQEKSAKYVLYLEKELDLMRDIINTKRKVAQMHFGGGSPNFLKPEEILKLGGSIRKRFDPREDAEVSIELDPRTLTQAHVSAIKSAGFNRASIGIQDIDNKVQKAINRIQPLDTIKKAVEMLRNSKINSINFDLVYGLPFQTLGTFENTLNEMIDLSPDRLAVFNCAYVPWIKPHQKMIKEDTLPSAQTKLSMLKSTIETLTSQGYVSIGMDHFAKENDSLAIAQRAKTLQRNFQGYSTFADTDIYAFGMSAISQGENLYKQNLKELDKYYQALDKGSHPIEKSYILTHDDKIRRSAIMRLMCDFELDYKGMSETLKIDFASYFSKELDSLSDMEADGLLKRSPGSLTVTDTGRLLVRNIAMRFDAYLRKDQKGFSKTI